MKMQDPASDRYILGLDVGSTTVKAVVADRATGEVLWKGYRRHETRQPETLLDFLETAEAKYPVRAGRTRAFITGSGGGKLAPLIGARFVQEVNAISLAVERLHPDTGSIIELGGQDAKIIIWALDEKTGKKVKVPSMNDKCAGGTGAVIDKIGAKLGFRQENLQGLPSEGVRLHQVAGRCGVFAETDINSLQKQGVPAEELMNSLFEAIVQQNLSVLTRGNALLPEVLLLGGPHTFIPALTGAWRRNIPRVWEERKVRLPEGAVPERLIRVPEDSQYFAAIGAVLFGMGEDGRVGIYEGTERLKNYLECGKRGSDGAGEPRFFAMEAERRDFVGRYALPSFEAKMARKGAVRGYIGIDGGSTSTKGVVLDEEGEIAAKAYRLSAGNPLEDTKGVIRELREIVGAGGGTLNIHGVGTTGYAKDMLKEALLADVAIVETVAHTKSALRYFNDVDIICDVGGQDIKVILLSGGRVKDFKLNTQCSAGNGYFLQSTARQFGYDVSDYADAAFGAERVPTFGYGCAVFLESDIVNFQQQGWGREEILAGLARVLPKNIWLYVVQEPNLKKLGRRFVLQGGTQRNLAAVKAQYDYIKDRVPEAEILVHPHTGESGAIGAALEAMAATSGRGTAFIGFDALESLGFTAMRDESTRCRFCKNRCLRTFIDLSSGGGDSRRYIIAPCEKGAVEGKDEMLAVRERLETVKRKNPDLSLFAQSAAFRTTDGNHPSPSSSPLRGEETFLLPPLQGEGPGGDGVRGERGRLLRIGIPRAINIWSTAPFFTAYLESVGIEQENIIFSDPTDEEMFKEGSRRGSIDQCFPSKAALAHVHNLLLKKDVDAIFFPILINLPSNLANTLRSCTCPTVQSTPDVCKAAFMREKNVFAERGVRYIGPVLNMAEPELLERQMYECFRDLLDVGRSENRVGVEKGMRALESFASMQREKGREVLKTLEEEGRVGLVLLGRPYHNDPGLNHGILEEIRKRGYPILTVDSLPADGETLDRLFGDEVRRGEISSPMDISDVWKNSFSENSSKKIWGAKYVARHPNLVALDLSNFKCGHDAPIYSVVEDILHTSGTPYFTFHDIDENRPTGSIKIRVETIDYFLRQYQEGIRKKGGLVSHFKRPFERPFTAKERKEVTLLFCGLTPAHEILIKGAFEGLGYRADRIPTPDNESLAMGKEYGNRGQCNPAYYMVGNLIKYLKKLRDEGVRDIEDRYVFVTVGGCGPCRFGMYEAEYKKALKDAGFDGFRVVMINQSGDVRNYLEEAGLKTDMEFYFHLIKGIMVGDLMNEIKHRVRPYEINRGDTERAVGEALDVLYRAFKERKGLIAPLREAKRIMERVEVDYGRIKPKVKVIGEFWAQTTEGDGNYKLPMWLEEEGCEVMVQPVSGWVDYLIWYGKEHVKDRLMVQSGIRGKWRFFKWLIMLNLSERLFRFHFNLYRAALGFVNDPLPSQKRLAGLAEGYYNTRVVGGEGHIEVAKNLLAIREKKAHLVISVKPFGCMPSSQSDGVQSRVMAEHKEGLFIPIETSGDGEVNVKSRVQMKLHEARERAKEEFERLLGEIGLSRERFREIAMKRGSRPAMLRLPSRVTTTAGNYALYLSRLSKS